MVISRERWTIWYRDSSRSLVVPYSVELTPQRTLPKVPRLARLWWETRSRKLDKKVNEIGPKLGRFQPLFWAWGCQLFKSGGNTSKKVSLSRFITWWLGKVVLGKYMFGRIAKLQLYFYTKLFHLLFAMDFSLSLRNVLTQSLFFLAPALIAAQATPLSSCLTAAGVRNIVDTATNWTTETAPWQLRLKAEYVEIGKCLLSYAG